MESSSRVMTGSGSRGAADRGYSHGMNDPWVAYLSDPRNPVYAKNITENTLSVKDRWNNEGLDVTVGGFECVDLSGIDRQQLSNSHSLKNALRNGLLILVNEDQYWQDQHNSRVRMEQAQAELNQRRQAEMIDVSGRKMQAEIIDGSSPSAKPVADPRQSLKDPIKYAAMVQQAMQQGYTPEQFADMVNKKNQIPMVQQQQPQFQPQQFQQPQQPQQFQPQQFVPPMAMPPEYPIQGQYQQQFGEQQPYQQPMQPEGPMTVEAQQRSGPRPVSPMGQQIQVPLGAGSRPVGNNPIEMTRTGGATIRVPDGVGDDAAQKIQMGNFNVTGHLPGWDGGYAENAGNPAPQQQQAPQLVYPGQPQFQMPQAQQPQFQPQPQPQFQPQQQAVYPQQAMYPQAQQQPMYPQVQPPPMQQQGPLASGQQEAFNAQAARQSSEVFEVDGNAQDDVAHTIAMIGGLPD